MSDRIARDRGQYCCPIEAQIGPVRVLIPGCDALILLERPIAAYLRLILIINFQDKVDIQIQVRIGSTDQIHGIEELDRKTPGILPDRIGREIRRF